MKKSDAAGTVACMVAAFAVSFFGTVLIRRSAPSADVAPSEWTADAERAARTREREESLSRSVAALRGESGRLSEQVARKTEDLSARVGKARAEAAKAPDSKPAPAVDGIGDAILKLMVREKIRLARDVYKLNPPQLAQYEASVREAMEKNSLQLLDPGDNRFDEEHLVPLLDRDQHAKFRAAERERAENKAKTDANTTAQLLGVNDETAVKVNQILREEGVQDPNLFLKFIGKPEETAGLVPHLAAATERARARLRPMLPPEAFQKLEQKFAADTESLKILLEELQKDAKDE